MRRLIRFTASWCQPCKALASNLEKAITDEVGLYPIEVVDIEEKPDYAVEFGIRSIPTLVMLEGNTEVSRVTGVKTPDQLRDWFRS